ncbi:MAG: hypothetical protein Ct9H300mP14_17100 [Gammaproteobacteria bacterium]|nr:MAG: hypothetical protein Ct9H300mP14_17100 [Gammaproteobacteria bacterium]
MELTYCQFMKPGVLLSQPGRLFVSFEALMFR